MPIFEYQCEECAGTFEKLVTNPLRAGGVACERCGSTRVVRLVSSFAAGAGRGDLPSRSRTSPRGSPQGDGAGGAESPWSGGSGGGCGCGSGCGCR